MTAVLEIEALSVETVATGGGLRVLDDVSLAVGKGEILGLVGPSGAGKTTLALATLKLLPAAVRMTGGRIRVVGMAVEGLREAEMRRLRGRRAALVVQDANAALDPLQRIASQLIETIRSHERLSRAAARARAARTLSAAGIADAVRILNSYPHQLSGGMRQRAAIALAICPGPALLIADEPVSSVDVAARGPILARLRQLASEAGLGVLLITHDLAVVAQTADRIAVLDRGRIVETGETQSVLGRPQHPVTIALLDSLVGRPRPAPRLVLVKSGHGVGGVIDRVRGGDPRDTALARVRQWLDLAGVPEPGRPMLVVERLSKTFRRPGSGAIGMPRRVDAVDGVSLRIGPGEIFGIVGESGSGKSTLARLIAGLEAASGGRIVFDGEEISPKALRRHRGEHGWPMQMVFQDPAGSLNPRLSAGAAIGEMIRIAAPCADHAAVATLTAALLASVGLPEAAAAKRPGAFSGGEQQRVVLARALAARPRLLICDEPTSALDLVNQAKILDLLAFLSAGLGLAALFISHDLRAVRRLCRRIGVMHAGRICEVAHASDLFESPQHAETCRLLSSVQETDDTLAALRPGPVAPVTAAVTPPDLRVQDRFAPTGEGAKSP